MTVLVSYLGRNQVFSLQENDKADQITDLKQKVSSYFGYKNHTSTVQQGMGHLHEEDIFYDRDRLQVTI